MNSLTKTQKLFHAVVVLGMAATLGCSGDVAPANDAATNDETSTAKDSSVKDVAVADVAQPNDASTGGDGFVGWLGC